MEHDPSILEDTLFFGYSYRLQDGTIAVDAVSGTSTSSWKSLMPTPVPPTVLNGENWLCPLCSFPKVWLPCLGCHVAMSASLGSALPLVSGSVSHLLSQLVWDAVSALWGLVTEPSTGSAMSYSLITARVLSVRQGENQKSVANSMSNVPTAVWGLGLWNLIIGPIGHRRCELFS